jgi:hypothetical protein
MLTSGDVQFEPTAAAKILALSNSMFLMTAGDAGLQAEICSHVLIEVAERIRQEPGKWWFVRDVADLYIEHYNRIQLAPLYLDPSSFIANQHSMNERLVNDTARELLNFQMPSISTIFAGHDPAGPHIYLVSESGANSLEANCLDGVGFAAIVSKFCKGSLHPIPGLPRLRLHYRHRCWLVHHSVDSLHRLSMMMMTITGIHIGCSRSR